MALRKCRIRLALLVLMIIIVTLILYILLERYTAISKGLVRHYHEDAMFESRKKLPLGNQEMPPELRYQDRTVPGVITGSKLNLNRGTALHLSHLSQYSLPHHHIEDQVGKEKRGISDVHKKSIEALARSLMSCKGVPGMTLGVVKDDDHWLLPLGVRDIDSNSPVTTKTKFFLGSVTKTFTAQLVALMIQESEGRLTWDTPVIEIMGPDFHLATDELTEHVTLRDILSHRSGLVSGNLAVRASLLTNMTRTELMRSFHLIPANFPLGTEFLYSNLGYTLAGGILETWWKQPWEELVKTKLLQPLGMDSSVVVSVASDVTAADFAKPYVPVEGRIEDCDPQLYMLGPIAVAGNLASTAEDMTTWIKFVLRKGTTPKQGLDKSTQLLDSQLLADMWRTNIQLGAKFKARTEKQHTNGWPQDDISIGYGIGWFSNRYKGLNNFWHGGGLYSYYSLVWVLPEVNMGFFISMNGYKGCRDQNETLVTNPDGRVGDHSNKTLTRNTLRSQETDTLSCMCGSSGFGVVEPLAYFITDTLLGDRPWINQTNGCTYPYPWVTCGHAGFNSTVKHSIALNQGNQGDQSVFSSETEPEKSDKSTNTDKISAKTHPERVLNFRSYKGVYQHPLLGNAFVNTKNHYTELHFHLRLLSGTLIFQRIDKQNITFGLECDGSYKFLSKPDSSKEIPTKQTFILTFHKTSRGEIGSLSVYYSADEVPFVFHRQDGRLGTGTMHT